MMWRGCVADVDYWLGGVRGYSRDLFYAGFSRARRGGGMADTEHSKCFDLTVVRVQIPLPAL